MLAVGMALEALAERVRRAAAAELVLERAVVLGARGRGEGRGVDGRGVLRGGEGGGHGGQDRRRGKPAEQWGVDHGALATRPPGAVARRASGLLKLGDTRGHPSPSPDAAHRRHPGDGGGASVSAAPGALRADAPRARARAGGAGRRPAGALQQPGLERDPARGVGAAGAGAGPASAGVRRGGGDARDGHARLHGERAVVPAPGPGPAGGADRQPAAAEGGADGRPAEPHRRGDLGAPGPARGDGVLRQQALPGEPDAEGGGGGLRRVREPELPAAGDAWG